MRLLLSVVGLGLLVQPGAASAHQVRSTVTIGDISTPDRLEQLERRVDRAARQACGVVPRVNGSGLEDRDARRCLADARERAKQKIAAVLEQRRSGG